VAASLSVACGSSNTNPTTPGGATGNDVFTAFVDGGSFSAPAAGISATASSAEPGSVRISATSGSGLTFITVILNLGFLNGPGTYPLGVSQSTTPGGTVQMLTGANGAVSSFTTPLSGAAGSLIVTSLTGTQIAGTFQVVVPATPPEAGMTQTVSGGTFNVPIAGGFVPATPANPGSTITATLNGTSFVAGTVAGAVSGSDFSLNGSATSAAGATSSIAFVFPQTSVGTYPWFSTTGPAVTVTVVVNGASYGGGTPGDTGSVTIASDSVAGVVQGSFSGTLTRGLTIANGQFTITLPPGSSARASEPAFSEDRSFFDRYDIVSESDLIHVGAKLNTLKGTFMFALSRQNDRAFTRLRSIAVAASRCFAGRRVPALFGLSQNCPRTVAKPSLLTRLEIAESEKQIPQVIENNGTRRTK